MAVWADFDDDDEPSSPCPTSQMTNKMNLQSPADQSIVATAASSPSQGPDDYIAHALRCYPVAEKLASYLDLTDLDALSSTCHLVRDSIVQFAPLLKQHSLRCAFDTEPVEDVSSNQDELLALQLSVEDQLMLGVGAGPSFPTSTHDSGPNLPKSSLGLSGKISRCARDLVAPCRRCGIIVCRNCIEKPPSNKRLHGRLRRLCDCCLEAPLIVHKAPLVDSLNVSTTLSSSSSSSSTRSARSDSSASEQSEVVLHRTEDDLLKMPESWLRHECNCVTRGVYLCQPCGHRTYTDDVTYGRVWSWRSRYSTHLGGGLGTGLGLGDQGQKCGRAEFCLATRDVMTLVECECSSEDALTPNAWDSSRSTTPTLHEEARPEPGYFRQEIEGIGHKIKSKSKKLVKVGHTVYEFRDERQTGRYLGREERGDLRAWCSWCSRVCPGKGDRAALEK